MTSATPRYPNRIKTCIQAAGYKVREITAELHIPDRTMRDYITGRTAMPREYLEALAGLIGCSIEDLVPRSASRPSDMPLPPQPYFAHPYPLQENFTGRIHERRMLTEWLTKDKRPVLALIALGGMGKSSLVWAWLQQDVLGVPLPGMTEPSREVSICQLSKRVYPQGVLWWSFYEPEASFATFLNRALMYMSSGSLDPRSMSTYEKIQALLALLQRHYFLLILDGFERELRAYASAVSAYQGDSVREDAQGNFRVCIDPHEGNFLRWLAASPLLSRVLLTTRLLPRELDSLAGCRREELSVLDPEDVLAFLQAQGVRGTRAEIHAVCAPYGDHPLALRLLAGLVVHDPARPGDIAVATEKNLVPEMVQREHHILAQAYDALRPSLQLLLSHLAAFRSVVDFETAKAVSPLKVEKELKAALRELVERGLLFFDRERQRYDLHPVVRQYAYARLSKRETVHARLAGYFQMSGKGLLEDLPDTARKIRILFIGPVSDGLPQVESLEDIAAIIELCHHRIRAKQFKMALGIYYNHLASLLYHRLGAYQTIIELLQGFLEGDETSLPQLESCWQSWLLDALANAYSASGYPQRAVQLLEESIQIDQERDDKESLVTVLWNLAVQQEMLGRLSASEQSLQESILLCRDIHDAFNEAKAHQYFALLRAYQGLFEAAFRHLDAALSLFKELNARASEGAVWAYRSLCGILAGKIPVALEAAQRARELADIGHYERDVIRAEWLLGLASVHMAYQEDGQRAAVFLREAELHLREALHRCRRIDMVDYEADLLLAWARLHHARGEKQRAKECATEALVITNRSDFRVLRADIYNLLARLECENGNWRGMRSLAEAALRDATCDGPPFCYVTALEEAMQLLCEVKRLDENTSR
jgi:tetratricopeptide (TPR) repeat protein